MSLRSLAVLVLAASLAACGDSGPVARGTSAEDAGVNVVKGPFKVLVFSRTAGFRHLSIPDGIAAVRSLGEAHDFAVDASEDPAVFTDANLAQYAVVMFLSTTGTVLEDAQRAAFERYIGAGGGYVGVHSAADTEYDWPFYGRLVGAYFKLHPLQQLATFDNEAPDHPSTAHLPSRWTILDEFYSFQRNPRPHVRVLLSIDESTYLPNPNTSNLPGSPDFPLGQDGYMGDHPMAWCHDALGGRAWYTALGHESYLYSLPEYREHLLNGILTAARRVEADCTPRG